MTKTVLIIGSHGRFGQNSAKAFGQAGWDVRRFDRHKQDLMQAVQGVQVIVMAANPLYHLWHTQLLGLHEQVGKAALSVDATVIVPGNVYVFGAQTPGPWGENTPRLAQNSLGQIRIKMERAYRDRGVRTIVLRGGDFLDVTATGSWFDKVMAPGLPKGVMKYPGRLDVAHAWAFLPDMTRAAVQLAEKREQLGRFEDISFPGFNWTGSELALALSQALGRDVGARKMAWWPVWLAQPFWSEARYLLEMRYLWDVPHCLDGSRFKTLLPDFQATDEKTALRQATEFLFQSENAKTATAQPKSI